MMELYRWDPVVKLWVKVHTEKAPKSLVAYGLTGNAREILRAYGHCTAVVKRKA